jgi:streptogramin lyase
VDVDTTRNLIWFSERDSDKLGRFDPADGSFIEFPLLTAGIEARRIFVDPVNPNRVWWGCASDIDRFGYLEVID